MVIKPSNERDNKVSSAPFMSRAKATPFHQSSIQIINLRPSSPTINRKIYRVPETHLKDMAIRDSDVNYTFTTTTSVTCRKNATGSSKYSTYDILLFIDHHHRSRNLLPQFKNNILFVIPICSTTLINRL